MHGRIIGAAARAPRRARMIRAGTGNAKVMAYRLKQDEGMATGLRRIVREELGKAIAELGGERSEDPDAAVHEARKHLKKARAALRLARFDVGAGLRREENARLRETQRRLGGARDAQVLLETLAGLRGPAGRPLPERTTRKLRVALTERRARARAGADEQRTAAIAELGAARDRVDGWPLRDEGFGATAAGLRRIQRDGRRARRAAAATTAAEEWHEWRKRVKDLWYATRILRPFAALELGALVEEADGLGELLGDLHDLAVLRAAVAEHGSDLTERQAAQIRAAIDSASAELRERAVAPGKRLHAERPKRLAERVAAYWEAR
jgi:CHAD domain-containing protein